MAFVSIQSCKLDILDSVQKMREVEVGTYMSAAGVPDASDLGLQELAERLIWGDNLYLKEKMPADWMAHRRDFRLDVQTPYGEWQVGVTFTNPDMQMLPPNLDHYIEVDIEAIDAPWGQTLLEAMERSQTIRNRYDTIAANLNTYLSSCKSLNEAVRHYPDLVHFVPQYYKDKMMQTSGKTPARKLSKAEQVLQTIDTSVITSAAVAARLGGAP